MSAVNKQWDERGTTFQQARSAFEAILHDLESQYAAMEAEPSSLSQEPMLTIVQEGLEELVLAARAVIQGLDAPDDGSQRQAAINHWSDSVEDFEMALAPPETTTTADPVFTAPTNAIDQSQTAAPAAEDATPEVTDPQATNGSIAGWIGVTALLVGLAYWLGRRGHTS
jgi:hypothetical protein